MKKLNNKSGFTLIEIIVVLIIVGILASIALPNLFSNVSKARAEEALATLSSFRPTVEACITKQSGVNDGNCNSANLGLPAASANFTYAITAPTAGNSTGYVLTATGTGALATGDTITMTKDTTQTWPAMSGAVTCVGAGKLLGAC